MKKHNKILTAFLSTSLVTSAFTPTVFAANEPTKEKPIFHMQGLDEETSKMVEAAAKEEALQNAKITKEKAIEIAKGAVDIPEGFVQENIRFDSYGDDFTWSIDWQKEGPRYQHIHVGVNAMTGKVIRISIHKNPEHERPSFPPEINFDKAVNIATEYMTSVLGKDAKVFKVDKDMEEELRLDPYYYERGNYSLHFYKEVNGVRTSTSHVNVEVTGNGEIGHFSYYNQDNIKFEANNNVLPQAEAEKLLKTDMDLGLRYIVERDYRYGKEQTNAYLAYVPSSNEQYQYYSIGSDLMLDAQTGEWIDYTGEAPTEEGKMELPEGPVLNDAKPLPDFEKELTQEQAMTIVKRHFEIPDGYELRNASYDQHMDRKAWNFYWDNPGKEFSHIRVAINAETGEVLDYNNEEMHQMYRKLEMNEDKESNYEAKVSKEEAFEKALSLVKDLAQYRGDKLYATQPSEQRFGDEEEPRAYHFFFVRKHDGIAVQSQGVNITISAEDGTLYRYNLDWQDIKLPSKNDVVSVEEATSKYFEEVDVELSYHVPVPSDPQERLDMAGKEKEAMLVYRAEYPNYQLFLDAKTGLWTNRATGKPVGVNKEITDIKGHWAEQQINTLFKYKKLSIEDGKFNPNQELTRAELIKLVMKAIGDEVYYGYSYDSSASQEKYFTDINKEADYYHALMEAIRRGIVKDDLKEFNPDGEATREWMAVLAVRALGYDKLAQVDGLFDVNFDDASQVEHTGHVGLAHRLNIISGYNNKFNPDKTITKAEAAVVMFNYLQKKAELQPNQR